MNNNEQSTPADVGQNQQTTPPPGSIGETTWVMNGINQLNARYDGLDERLRAIENKISKATGWLTAGIVLLALLQIGLKFIDISITVN